MLPPPMSALNKEAACAALDNLALVRGPPLDIMEPRREHRENAVPGPDSALRPAASMEPQREHRGNHEPRVRHQVGLAASMEPRP